MELTAGCAQGFSWFSAQGSLLSGCQGLNPSTRQTPFQLHNFSSLNLMSVMGPMSAMGGHKQKRHMEVVVMVAETHRRPGVRKETGS